MTKTSTLTSIEICAGAGGMALGLERAGFHPLALVEIDEQACLTLEANRKNWNVIQADANLWDPQSELDGHNLDLLAGGVPCPPFSIAGKQLGADDERDLFPRMVELTKTLNPRCVLIENVRGLLEKRFAPYRQELIAKFSKLGYRCDWQLLTSADFGVPQLRPRSILVAMRDDEPDFNWPIPNKTPAPTVGETLEDLMASQGWEGASRWAKQADKIAPTLVGGSKKHGGPDLGPSRARAAWEKLGVNGKSLADHPPLPGDKGNPRLTVRMAARIQGFPDDWQITGRKTRAYRQVGNAFPPPVAEAVGRSIAAALAKAAPQPKLSLAS